MITPAELAKVFAAKCAATFTSAELAEIKRRNASREYPEGICATHDFADANMIMDEAFTEATGRSIVPDEGEISEADSALWNEAWTIAKRDHLTAR